MEVIRNAILERIESKSVDEPLTEDGSTCLHHALETCPDMIDEVLEMNPDVNKQNFRGVTPLHVACKFRDKEEVKKLLEHKADVNTKTCDGKTALHFMIYFNKDYRDLLSYKADINCPDDDDITPLMLLTGYASSEDDYKYLDIDKVDFDFSGKNGNVLHFSTNTKVLSYLIEHKVDVNCKDINGNTALYTMNSLESFMFLINSKIDVNSKNNYGHTILDHILLRKDMDEKSKENLTRILLSHGHSFSNKSLLKFIIDKI